MAIIVDRLNTAILSALGGPVVIFRGTLGNGGGGGVTDHGALTGLTDDDHPQYALADGSRGAFATAAQGALADSAVQPSDGLSGDLSGTYASPVVSVARGLRETGGPTSMEMAVVADGAFLYRKGSEVAGAGFGSSAGTICEGNDSRLSDARTPTSHASSHQSGGGDAIKLDDLAAPDDNTDLDATTSAHGLLPKLGGGSTNFLRADGTWSAPPGGTPGGSSGQVQFNDSGAFGGSSSLTYDDTTKALKVGAGETVGVLSVRTINANTNGSNAILSLNGQGGGYGVYIASVYCGTGVHAHKDYGYLGWSGGWDVANTADTRFYRDGAPGAVALRVDTTAHSLSIYGTWSGSGANYERVRITHNGIALESAGTGAANRDLTLTPAGTGNLVIGSGKLQHPTAVAVASLGSASPAGQRTFVNDANATIFYSIVAGGGSNYVPVFSDGTNWRIG